MGSKFSQQGITVIGLVTILVILGFGLLIGLRLVPVYLESFKIDQAMQGVIEDPSVASQSKRDIAYSLVRRLDLDDVRRIKESNYKEYVEIKKNQDKVAITVAYQAEVPLFGNLSLVADFDKHVQN